MVSNKNKTNFKFFSYSLLQNLNQSKKIDKIFSSIKEGFVIVIEGRLTPEEENKLTEISLKNVSKDFSGIEIAYLSSISKSKSKNTFFENLKGKVINILAKDRFGITIIGPSKKIKELKMNPQELDLQLK